MNIHLRNEGQELKTSPVWGYVLVGEVRVNEEGKGG
jgi:hypothetical protein